MGHSDDDSDHAEYGTALDTIEEDDVSRKRPITVSEQIAVDEKGRRRFHGAFTGGFSAGYFNTVGSKEGWTPSNFKSSRNERGSLKSQNVLDFMDDEDKGAFGIAPQVLRPTDDFSDTNNFRGQKRTASKRSDGPIPGMPILDQILQPVRETVGLKILVKMGWRPGKGVGQRMTRSRMPKRPKMTPNVNDVPEADNQDVNTAKMYGCSLPPELLGDRDSNESSEEDTDELLAPEDVNSVLCNPKENTFGLGYKGLDRNSLTAGNSNMDLFGTKLKFRVENKNLSISGQAFGVGAFEENDDDIYSKEDMSQYDFALETAEERKRKKGQERDEKYKKKIRLNCIDGFKPSSHLVVKRSIPPPIIPPNFQPFHSSKKSRFEVSSTTDENEIARSKGLARHSLTISERQVLIEDDVNKIIPKRNSTTLKESIDEDNVQAAPPKPESDQDIKNRIERLKKFTQVLQTYSSKTTEGGEKMAFKPFMKNPEKQERYDKYLTLRDAGFAECLKDLQPPDMTEWEKDREKTEFERASKLYKPMNSILASRFVSAKSHDISHLEPVKEPVLQKDPKDDPKVAAFMNLYGKLTHRVMEWHPDKLVCKRFNIPHPYPDSKFVGVKGDPSTWGVKSRNIMNAETHSSLPAGNLVVVPGGSEKKKSLFDNLDFSKPPPGLIPKEGYQASSSTKIPMESSGGAEEISLAPVLEIHRELSSLIPSVDSNKDAVAPERPPLDLFKEIFADSSDSEDEEEKTELNTRKVNQDRENESHLISQHMLDKKDAVCDDKPLDKMLCIKNDSKSLLPENESVNRKKDTLRRGVFDGIDLDRLQESIHERTTGKKTRLSSSESDEDTSDKTYMYGPAPPKITSSSPSRQQSGKKLSTKESFGVPGLNKSSHHDACSNVLGDAKKEVNTEEVIWVEKSTLAQDSCSSKSQVKNRKHSSKKSRRKSSKKEKHKSHKSKRHKHKKKSRKHKSKSAVTSDESTSSANDDAASDASSSDSVKINDSLDNRALLAKLKQITRSN